MEVGAASHQLKNHRVEIELRGATSLNWTTDKDGLTSVAMMPFGIVAEFDQPDEDLPSVVVLNWFEVTQVRIFDLGTVTKNLICPRCSGTGADIDRPNENCVRCLGLGMVDGGPPT